MVPGQVRWRRIFVLTPEGAVLRVCKLPVGTDLVRPVTALCHFDGKLLLAEADLDHEGPAPAGKASIRALCLWGVTVSDGL